MWGFYFPQPLHLAHIVLAVLIIAESLANRYFSYAWGETGDPLLGSFENLLLSPPKGLLTLRLCPKAQPERVGWGVLFG